MKDIPIFTTEYGAASLILKEIPYRKSAYVHIQNSLDPEKLIEECTGFCTMCGADTVYATGSSVLEKYPFAVSILYMSSMADEISAPENLWPVTSETVGEWRNLYNSKMRHVSNAATLEARDEERIVQSPGAYFVHHNGELLGIGWIKGKEIAAIASVKPGAGDSVLKTLLSLLPNEQVFLEVASNNHKAIKLYKRNGFLITKEISRWYQIK